MTAGGVEAGGLLAAILAPEVVIPAFLIFEAGVAIGAAAVQIQANIQSSAGSSGPPPGPGDDDDCEQDWCRKQCEDDAAYRTNQVLRIYPVSCRTLIYQRPGQFLSACWDDCLEGCKQLGVPYLNIGANCASALWAIRWICDDGEIPPRHGIRPF